VVVLESALQEKKLTIAKEVTEKLYYYQEALASPRERLFIHFARIYGLEKSRERAMSENEVRQLFAEAQSKEDPELLKEVFR